MNADFTEGIIRQGFVQVFMLELYSIKINLGQRLYIGI
jgi:hypothetical protein